MLFDDFSVQRLDLGTKRSQLRICEQALARLGREVREHHEAGHETRLLRLEKFGEGRHGDGRDGGDSHGATRSEFH